MSPLARASSTMGNQVRRETRLGDTLAPGTPPKKRGSRNTRQDPAKNRGRRVPGGRDLWLSRGGPAVQQDIGTFALFSFPSTIKNSTDELKLRRKGNKLHIKTLLNL